MTFVAVSGGRSVETSTLSSNKSITTALPSREDTGLSVTFTVTDASKAIFIGCCIHGANAGGGVNSISLAYSIDAGGDNEMSAGTSNVGRAMNLSCELSGGTLSAGEHTVKLRAGRDSTINWTLFASTGGYGAGQFYVKYV